MSLACLLQTQLCGTSVCSPPAGLTSPSLTDHPDHPFARPCLLACIRALTLMMTRAMRMASMMGEMTGLCTEQGCRIQSLGKRKNTLDTSSGCGSSRSWL